MGGGRVVQVSLLCYDVKNEIWNWECFLIVGNSFSDFNLSYQINQRKMYQQYNIVSKLVMILKEKED